MIAVAIIWVSALAATVILVLHDEPFWAGLVLVLTACLNYQRPKEK